MQFASVVEKRWWSNRAPEVEQFQPWLTRCSKVCNKKRNGEILGTFYQFQRGEFQRTLKKLEIPKYWVNAQGFFFHTGHYRTCFFFISESPLSTGNPKKLSTLAIQPELNVFCGESPCFPLVAAPFKKKQRLGAPKPPATVTLSLWPVQAMVLFLNFSLKATVT